MPLVSIVMPTFNRASFLKRSIESVLAQTMADWELIIVDDGGTDETPDVVAPYLSDPRIRYFWHSNRGVGKTRNAGLAHARGRYVTFLDSDDAYLPPHLESRVAFMAKHPDVDLVQGGLEVVGDAFVVDFDNPERRISIYDCACGATFFGKRDVFQALEGFAPLRNFEDTDLWRRAQARFVTKTPALPQTYVYFRHDASLTAAALASQPGFSEMKSVG